MLSSEALADRAKVRSNEQVILDLLFRAEKPMSAYEVLAALDGTSIKAATQVYRALEKLMHQQKVHRIESLNAFVACQCDHRDGPAAFLVCSRCGAATEFDPGAGVSVLYGLANGFKVQGASVELKGLCAVCQTKEGPAA